MGSLVKQGYFKKRVVVVSLIFIPSSHFQCYLSLGNLCVYLDVFCLFTPFLSLLFMSHRKNLVLFHLINRCMTSASE